MYLDTTHADTLMYLDTHADTHTHVRLEYPLSVRDADHVGFDRRRVGRGNTKPIRPNLFDGDGHNPLAVLSGEKALLE